jgi:hypothetical protein
MTTPQEEIPTFDEGKLIGMRKYPDCPICAVPVIGYEVNWRVLGDMPVRRIAHEIESLRGGVLRNFSVLPSEKDIRKHVKDHRDIIDHDAQQYAILLNSDQNPIVPDDGTVTEAMAIFNNKTSAVIQRNQKLEGMVDRQISEIEAAVMRDGRITTQTLRRTREAIKMHKDLNDINIANGKLILDYARFARESAVISQSFDASRSELLQKVSKQFTDKGISTLVGDDEEDIEELD